MNLDLDLVNILRMCECTQ